MINEGMANHERKKQEGSRNNSCATNSIFNNTVGVVAVIAAIVIGYFSCTYLLK